MTAQAVRNQELSTWRNPARILDDPPYLSCVSTLSCPAWRIRTHADYTPSTQKASFPPRPVKTRNIEDGTYKMFPSLAKAARFIKTHLATLRNNLNTGIPTQSGWIVWDFCDDEPELKPLKTYLGKNIFTGEKIKCGHIAEIAMRLHLHKSTITKAIHHNTKTYQGWLFWDSSKSEPIPEKKKNLVFLRNVKTGKIRGFPTCKDAAIMLHLSTGNLPALKYGRIKTLGGWQWVQAEDVE